MYDVHQMSVFSLDLDLLQAFAALFERRNLTRAAAAIELA